MLTCTVTGQSLAIVSPEIVADTLDYLTAEFAFSSDWDGLTKWAHFSQGDTVWDIALVDDAIPKSAHLNLGTGRWDLYLHGNELDGETVVERITTQVRPIRVQKSGVLNGVPLPEVPATAAEQIDAKASNALLIAQGVRTDLDTFVADVEDDKTAAEDAAAVAAKSASAAAGSESAALESKNTSAGSERAAAESAAAAALYASGAANSATESGNARDESVTARNDSVAAKNKVESIVDSIYYNLVAPPLSAINDAIILDCGAPGLIGG